MSWHDVPTRVHWVEAAHLIAVLLRDPASWLQAAMNGWKHPVSREWMVLAEQVDLTLRLNAKKGARPRPLARPWDGARKPSAKKLAQEEIRARLRRMKGGA